MRVLITGGAGFIGANLCRHLMTAGDYEVTVLDDLSAGQTGHRLPGGVSVVIGDYTNSDILDRCLPGNDAVVHLAAVPGVVDSIEDPTRSFRVNVEGSFRLLQLARKAEIHRFIFASTAGALFGGATPPICEAMSPAPLSPYGASKLAVEAYCSAFAAAYGLNCVTLRLANVYGPQSGHKRSVVAAFTKNIIRNEPLVIYGDGSQQRDFLYVDDLVGVIETLLMANVTGVYHLGYGKPASLGTLIEMLEKAANRKAVVCHQPSRRGEVHSSWCNIDKARRDLGYAPSTSLETGLRATWAWYVENEALWKDCR
jgi:UDP-glucose 4-epimerase